MNARPKRPTGRCNNLESMEKATSAPKNRRLFGFGLTPSTAAQATLSGSLSAELPTAIQSAFERFLINLLHLGALVVLIDREAKLDHAVNARGKSGWLLAH